MSTVPRHRRICWRVFVRAPVAGIFDLIATDKGRCRFWCESSQTKNGLIEMRFPNGVSTHAEILVQKPPHALELVYFAAPTKFSLSAKGGGCVVELTADVEADEFDETNAGWVSVLLNLKAVGEFGVDLRNHDAACSWDQGYVDN